MKGLIALALITAAAPAACRRPAADVNPEPAANAVREAALRWLLAQEARDIGIADAEVYCIGEDDDASAALRAQLDDVASDVVSAGECGPPDGTPEAAHGRIVHRPTGRRAIVFRFGDLATPEPGVHTLEVSYVAGAMHGQGFDCTVERAAEEPRVRACRSLWIS